MQTTAWISLVYGLLVLMGGIMGHIKAQSLMSLIAGIIFGALLLTSSFLLFKGKLVGRKLALTLVVILDVFFLWRFAKTHNFMPPGMMSLVSLVTTFLLIFCYKKNNLKTQP